MHRISRREFLKASAALAGAASVSGAAMPAYAREETPVQDGGLFPEGLPAATWVTFRATGFKAPVTGVIYDSGRPPCCGVPLGGLSTGCIDLDPSGAWGMSTIFSDFTLYSPNLTNGLWRGVPRHPPSYAPFLGLSLGGKTWVLATGRVVDGGVVQACTEPADPPQFWSVHLPKIEGVEAAKQIRYWGHYPVADLHYDIDAPVRASLRAWSPFIPGDAVASNVPGAVFEVRLKNTDTQSHTGTLVFTFPGPADREARGARRFRRRDVKTSAFTGTVVGAVSAFPAEYALGVFGPENVRLGGALGVNGQAWSRIHRSLPAVSGEDGADPGVSPDRGVAAAVDFRLEPGQQKVVRFVLAWFAPQWIGQDDATYTYMYATRHRGAQDVATLLANDHKRLLDRVLAWQEAIYTSRQLPDWLRDALINSLALIPEDSFWTLPNQAMPWVGPEGFFGLMESPRGCPQIECIPCSWYGNQPVVFLFPGLAYRTMLTYLRYVSPEGEAPFTMGGLQAAKPYASQPGYFWQRSLNGMCYVDLVDRLWQRTGDDAILREFYSSVKSVTTYTMNLRPGPGGVISMPKGNAGMEWFEAGKWAGMCAHLGGLHLAQLRIAQRMAERSNDAAFAKQCREWLKSGSAAMEGQMWTGSYYLNFWEPDSGAKSDDVMAYQLDGEWAARFHGLPGVFRADRVRQALETIKRCNVSHANCGAVNFARPDGSLLDPTSPIAAYGVYDMFPPEVLVLAMTYMYAGKREFGLELARRSLENVTCRHPHPWDLPNRVRGDTGKRTFGTDYYQNLMIWSLPAAIAGKDLAWLCREGGLIDRMVRAGGAGRDLSWAASDAGPIAVKPPETAQAVICNESFFDAVSFQWTHHAEPMAWQDHHYMSAGQLGLSTVNGVTAPDVKAAVNGDTGAVFGVVFRFRDKDNYALAAWSPADGGQAAVREKTGGQWGDPLGAIGVRLSGKARIIVEAVGANVSLVIQDDSHCLRSECRLTVPPASGGVGLYHDGAAGGKPALFDDFHAFQITSIGAKPKAAPSAPQHSPSAPPVDTTK